jgi:adenylyltransferase/sulfurtransferase
MQKISVQDCKVMLERGAVEIIDVREPWEVAICEMGGKHIPMHEITEKVSILQPENAYVIVCKTGRRAEAVANLLETEFGFEQVLILDGGITEWFAVEKPDFEMY